MGLSSSQARLLNLTNRMHQIEYNAARIEAMKLQMANESRRVYEDYLEALDQAKIQKKTLTTNGAVTFVDMKNYKDFVDTGFALVVHGVPDSYHPDMENPDYIAWKAADDPDAWLTEWQSTHLGESAPEQYIEDTSSTVTSQNGAIICTTEAELVSAIKKIFKDKDGRPLDITQGLRNNFEETITNLINSGSVTILKKPEDPSKYQGEIDDTNGFPKLGTNAFVDCETSVATCTSLQEVTDEVKLRKAEAKYEADMKRIDMKDRRYDSDLAALDNERNAIKQEMETLKTVARDNVERTFKIFS